MPLRLRHDVHWCESGGRVILLDVTADRYFCVPSEARPAFQALAAGEAGPQDRARLDMLTRRGLLVESASPGPFQQPALVEPPSRDFLDYPAPRCSAVAILRALAYERRAAWRLRTRPFRDVIPRTRSDGVTGREAAVHNGPAIRSIAAAADAIAFVTCIADRAEAANHHPDIDIRWRKVRIALTTHDAGGLTDLDFDLATEIEGCLT